MQVWRIFLSTFVKSNKVNSTLLDVVLDISEMDMRAIKYTLWIGITSNIFYHKDVGFISFYFQKISDIIFY